MSNDQQQTPSCAECAHFYSGVIDGLTVGMSACRADPDGRKRDWRYARRMPYLCGESGAWFKPREESDGAAYARMSAKAASPELREVVRGVADAIGREVP